MSHRSYRVDFISIIVSFPPHISSNDGSLPPQSCIDYVVLASSGNPPFASPGGHRLPVSVIEAMCDNSEDDDDTASMYLVSDDRHLYLMDMCRR